MTADPWPLLAGRLDGASHVLPVRVYFEDTDFSGIVYHGAYVRFFERGRSDFIRLLGVEHQALARGQHGGHLAFAVRRMTLDFRKPARIDDIIEVRSRLLTLSGVRIAIAQSVVRSGEILVEAEVEVVLLNDAGRLSRIPAAIRSRLAAATPD